MVQVKWIILKKLHYLTDRKTHIKKNLYKSDTATHHHTSSTKQSFIFLF